MRYQDFKLFIISHRPNDRQLRHSISVMKCIL